GGERAEEFRGGRIGSPPAGGLPPPFLRGVPRSTAGAQARRAPVAERPSRAGRALADRAARRVPRAVSSEGLRDAVTDINVYLAVARRSTTVPCSTTSAGGSMATSTQARSPQASR